MITAGIYVTVESYFMKHQSDSNTDIISTLKYFIQYFVEFGGKIISWVLTVFRGLYSYPERKTTLNFIFTFTFRYTYRIDRMSLNDEELHKIHPPKLQIKDKTDNTFYVLNFGLIFNKTYERDDLNFPFLNNILVHQSSPSEDNCSHQSSCFLKM